MELLKRGRIDGAMPRDVHTNAFPWTLQGKELRKRDILNIPLCLNTREMSRLRLIRLLCSPLMKPHLDFRPAVGDLSMSSHLLCLLSDD